MIHATTSILSRAARFGIVIPFVFAGTTYAQQESEELLFEEIVVTVQKREQDIMDVPVAVTAVSGAEIEASGIKDVFDLQQNVPSLIMGQSQTSTTSNFSIRSVGSTANNFGVESSVGLYVDGVYRSRQSSMINDLVDIEAVEVLRGPQGTIFGKNTAAGAIHVRTVRPSQDRDAFVEVTAGDYGLVKVGAAANIPINDKLAFRGSIFSHQRDGYVDDVALGEDILNDRDRIGGRLQLAYNEPGDDFNWRLILDYAELNEICCVGVTRVDNIVAQHTLTNPIPTFGTDFSIFLLGGTVFTDFPYPEQQFLDQLRALPVCDPIGVPCFLPNGFPGRIFPGGQIISQTGFDDYVTALSFLPDSQNEDSGLSFELNKTFGNGATLTSVTALRAFDSFDYADVDFTNLPVLERTNDATQDSISQELRLAGEWGEGNNYVIGAYYFEQEIVNRKLTDDAGFLPLFLGSDPRLAGIAGIVNTFATNFGAFGFQPASPFPVLPGSTALDVTTQDQDSWAVFGQVEFALGDSLIATLGARYTDETKDIDAVYTSAPLPTGTPRADFLAVASMACSLDALCAPFLPPGSPTFDLANPANSLPTFQPFFTPGWGIFAFEPLAPRDSLVDTLSEDQVTGTAKLTWLPTETSMFYLSYATGFKSGGTNDDRIAPVFDQIFTAETSESIELGFKGDIGPVRLSIAVYDTDFEDFQANSFTGTGFNLQNAGDLETNGYEVEFIWRPFPETEISGYYARNEGKYKSFENGTCQDAYPFHTGLSDPGLQPSDNPLVSERCSRTGEKLGYNPENQFFVAVSQNVPVGNNSLFFRAEMSYYSDLLTDGDLDPFTFQDDINIVNFRVGYAWTDSNSDITLWGRNITDERWYHGSFDAPAQEGHMNSYPSQPSTWGVTFRKNFD